MVVHIEFEAVYMDSKRFVHARQVLPSELYNKTVAWRILEPSPCSEQRERKRKAQAEQKGQQSITHMLQQLQWPRSRRRRSDEGVMRR